MSTIHDDVRAAIETHLNTEWGSESPITWPNVVFNPKGLEKWIAPHILPAFAEQEALTGDQTGQFRGWLLEIQVFVPQNTGSGVIDGLCDTLEGIFNRTTITVGTSDSAIFGVPVVQAVGNDADEWYQKNVSIPFHVHR